MIVFVFVVLLDVVRGTPLCVPLATVQVGDSIQARDESLCVSGTLVLQPGIHNLGSVEIKNAAVINGNDASVTAVALTFVQSSVALSAIDITARSMAFVSLVLRDSRITHTELSLGGSHLLIANATFVKVNFTSNPQSLMLEVKCELGAMIESNLTFVGARIISLRKTQLKNTTLVVIHTTCQAELRVALEGCTSLDSNITVVNRIKSGCVSGASLEVGVAGTSAAGGSLSVASVLDGPVSLSVVNTSLANLRLAVSMNLGLLPGSPPQALRLTVWRSFFDLVPLSIKATGEGKSHSVAVSIQESTLLASPIMLDLCSVREIAVSSLGNQYIGLKEAIQIGDLYQSCTANVLFAAVGDALEGTQLVIGKYNTSSLSITRMIARGAKLNIGANATKEALRLAVVVLLTPNGSAVFESSTFDNCTVGTVLNVECRNVVVRNCTFTNVTTAAGALYIWNPKSVSIFDSTFSRIVSLRTGLSRGCVSVDFKEEWGKRLFKSAGWDAVVSGCSFSSADTGLNITASYQGYLELLDTDFDSLAQGVTIACNKSLNINATLLSFTSSQSAWSQTGCYSEIDITDSRFVGNRGMSLISGKFLPQQQISSKVRFTNVEIFNNTMGEFLISVSVCYLSAESCQFNNNTAPSPVITASTIGLTDCTAIGNKNAGKNFGGGFAYATEISDYDGTYIENHSEKGGGTFAAMNIMLEGTRGFGSSAPAGGFASASSIFVQFSMFVGCTSSGDGGVLLANSVGILKSNFTNCTAGGRGGCVFSPGFVTDTFSRFTKCTSKGHGGAIHGEDTWIVNSYFEDCSSSSGGSVRSVDLIVSNSTFLRCTSAGRGGAVYSVRAELSTSNFTDCYAKDDGGAIHVNKSSTNLTISASSFTECTSAGRGGAVYAFAAELSTVNFKSCNAKGDGGAIYVNQSNTSASSFTKCTSAGRGGAVYAVRAELSTSNFTDCKAEDDGGAIHVNESSTISASSFTECASAGRGGAVYAFAVELSTSNFTSCNAKGDGGALYVNKPKISASSFTKSWSVRGSGGAVYAVEASLVAANFTGCSAFVGEGGAIYVFEATISSSSFTKCVARGKGGGVLVINSMDVRDVTFESCTSTFGSGGGVASANSTLGIIDIRSSRFIRCTAPLGGVGGGAVDAWKVSVVSTEHEDCRCRGNGGAIKGDYVSIVNSTFKRCFGQGPSSRGGAISGGEVKMSRSIVQDCNAISGGAVFAYDAPDLRFTTFTRCQALTDGGAIFVTTNITALGLIFENCTAEVNGGAIYANRLIANNSIFTRSSASVSGGALWGVDVTVTDSTFRECASEQHGGAVGGTRNLTVQGSKFSSCRARGLGGAIYGSLQHRSYTILVNCSFSQCLAFAGGAVYSNYLSSTQSRVQYSKSNTVGGGFAAADDYIASGDVFLANKAATGGAVWCLGGTMIGLAFNGNEASDSGGAVYSTNRLSLSQCTFADNSARDRAGAVRVSSGRVQIQNVVMLNNSASYAGGLQAQFVHGSNVSFVKNTAVSQGGALLVTGSFELVDAQFMGNTATEGSAVFFDTKNQSVSVLRASEFGGRCKVLGNTGHGVAATAVFASGPDSRFSARFSGVDFVQNRGYGMFGQVAALLIDKCHFADNSAEYFFQCNKQGNQLCAVSISNSTHEQNEWAIAVGTLVSINISDSQICNTSNARGELLTLSRSIVVLSRVSFIGNSPLFKLEGSRLNATSVVMINNTRNFLLNDSTLFVRDFVCRNNTNEDSVGGTCVAMLDSRGFVQNLTASDNTANFGGDVSVRGNRSILQIVSSTFTRSKATAGGSIYAERANVTLEDCSIEFAVNAMGQTSVGLPYTIHDAYISQPMMAGAALAFISEGHSLYMTRCRVSKCEGQYGALAVIGDAYVALRDVHFEGNRAVYGGAMAFSAPEKSRVLIEGGAAVGNYATYAGVMLATPNIEVSSASNIDWSENTAVYGDSIALRAVNMSLRVTYEGGNEVPLKDGTLSVAVGVGVVAECDLLNILNGIVLLGSNFEVRLEAIDTSGTTRFEPPLDSYRGLGKNGTATFPSVRVTGAPGTVVPMILVTKYLPPFPFAIRLEGCPLSYGLTPYGAKGMTCVLCEKGEYSYGGISQCNACGDNMKCEGKEYPMSTKGYWITPVRGGRVKSVKCPDENLCLEWSKCAPGYNISSLVCGECVSGKHHWNGKCVTCSESKAFMLVAVIFMFVAVNLYALFIQRTALPSPTASLKILLQYSQVALLVVPRIPSSSTTVEMPVHFLSGNAGWVSLLPCFIRMKPAMLFHGAGVFSAAAITILLLHRVIWEKWKKRQGQQAQRATTYNSIISLLFMSVFSTTSSLLDFLSCVPVFEDQMVVMKAPSILCTGDSYRFHCSLLAGYSGAAWLVLGLMLAKIIIQYNRSPSRTTTLWTFMFYHFEDEYPQRASYLTKWEFYRARLRSQFCRWWQCVMLVRRVTLLAVYVMVKREKVDATLAFPLILVAFLYIHVQVNPYKGYFDDLTDGVGILLLLIASLLSRYLVLCYATVLSGSSFLAAYMLYDTLSRRVSACRHQRSNKTKITSILWSMKILQA